VKPIKYDEKAIGQSLKQTLKLLDQEVERLEKLLANIVSRREKWAINRDDFLTSKVAGNTLAYTVLADLPELGKQQISWIPLLST
jgi:transposase